jgi:uncharacterized protein
MQQFFEAIKAGDTAKVASLLDASPELVDARDAAGVAAVAVAKYNRREDVVRLLESRGATLDVFTAAIVGRVERMRELLAADPAPANAFSPDGWTPLHLAAYFGQRDAAELLIRSGAVVNMRSNNSMSTMPLHAAAAGRHIELVRLLLEHDAPVNARQHGGWTPLHAAAQNGDIPMTELLIGAGAQVKSRADNNQTPLDLALIKGNQDMADVLGNFGAFD